MKKIFYNFSILLFITLFYSNTTFSQWTIQNLPTSSKLEALYFINSNVGFTAGGFVSQMYKTIDGGQSWTPVGNYPARDIWFADASNGYASSSTGSANGSMKKTTNGGNTWTGITPLNSSSMSGVFTTSPTTAYFLNTEDKVIKTTNSGGTLTSYLIPLPNANMNSLTDIYFTDANTGYVCATGGYIFKTTNAGTTWNILTTNITSSLNSINFINSSVGYAAGAGGKVIKTNDGGNTWTDKSINTTYIINAIKFYDENNGLAVCMSGKIYRTDNGGNSWVEEVSGTTNNLYNVFYLSSSAAVIVGDTGIVLTNNNLVTVNNFTKTNKFKLYPNPAKDKITISNNETAKESNVSIFDIRGMQITYNKFNNQNIINIDVSTLKKGVYLINIQTDKVFETKKLIIQ